MLWIWFHTELLVSMSSYQSTLEFKQINYGKNTSKAYLVNKWLKKPCMCPHHNHIWRILFLIFVFIHTYILILSLVLYILITFFHIYICTFSFDKSCIYRRWQHGMAANDNILFYLTVISVSIIPLIFVVNVNPNICINWTILSSVL